LADASRVSGLAVLALHLSLLVLLPALVAATGLPSLALFDSFYRAGSFVFGGGHVVLPLLRAELVPQGWLSDAQFLAGYGAAQALPGPLFTFAAYLGTVISPGRLAFLNGLCCLFAIFLPAWLVVGAALPFWQRFRTATWAEAALAGANAAVVGVLLAAFYNPVLIEGVQHPSDVVLALLAFGLLESVKLPSWLVVGGLALFGHALQSL
jgi:chromate transporter